MRFVSLVRHVRCCTATIRFWSLWAVLSLASPFGIATTQGDQTAVSGPDASGTDSATLLLAIDDVSLPLRKNVCLFLNKPAVRREPVLEPSAKSDAPDNLAAHFYGTVLHDGGRFRMWYYACHRGLNPDWPPTKRQQVAKQPGWVKGRREDFEIGQGPLCYAESADGIVWTKPALGQVLFKGSRDNNALDLPHTIVSGAAVIRDDADPDPARRYKMVYQFFPEQTDPPLPEYGTQPSIACAVSPDGLAWKVVAMPFVNEFVEHCSFIRHGGRYIVHYQAFGGERRSGAFTEGGARGGRMGLAHWTYDFARWPDLWQWAFALPEPADPGLRGVPNPYDQVHLGVGAASFGNVCVGLYGLWHDRVHFGEISGDLGLVVSNDGVRFREVTAAPGQPYIHRDDSPATPVAGRSLKTILCQGNGILNVGDETRIYHGRWLNPGVDVEALNTLYRADVALATLPRDRWGWLALNPGVTEGTVGSAVISLPGQAPEIVVNADAARGLRVELLDERFEPIAGFSGPDSGSPAAADGLDCPVVWPRADLAAQAGRPVRVLVHLHDSGQGTPRLYAMSVRSKAAAAVSPRKEQEAP
jgi:hypothetical protein